MRGIKTLRADKREPPFITETVKVQDVSSRLFTAQPESVIMFSNRANHQGLADVRRLNAEPISHALFIMWTLDV